MEGMKCNKFVVLKIGSILSPSVIFTTPYYDDAVTYADIMSRNDRTYDYAVAELRDYVKNITQ